MIKHVVLLTWKDGTPPEKIDAVTTEFRALGDQIAEVLSYSFGQDAGIYRGNADYALVAEFRNESDLKAYVNHPSHQEFLASVTGPILDSFQAVQFFVEE